MDKTSRASSFRLLALTALVAVTIAPAIRSHGADPSSDSQKAGADRASPTPAVLAQGRCVWVGNGWRCV